MTELTATDSTSPPANVRATRVNLSSLEKIRREASKVYRDMRSGIIAHQDGTRLIYSLVSIGKMLEAEHAQQLLDPTVVDQESSNMVYGINLDKLTKEELDALEVAVAIAECIKEGRPVLEPPPELRAYSLSIAPAPLD